MCSKLTVKTPEPLQWRRFIFFVSFGYNSYLVLVFLFLTLSRLMSAGFLFNFLVTSRKKQTSFDAQIENLG